MPRLALSRFRTGQGGPERAIAIIVGLTAVVLVVVVVVPRPGGPEERVDVSESGHAATVPQGPADGQFSAISSSAPAVPYSAPERGFMAQHWGIGLVETRGELKLAKLEKAMNKAFEVLGYTQSYAGKAPPEEENPEENLTPVELLDNGDGVLAIRVGEDQVVRDLARLVAEDVKVPLLVLLTAASLFHRRSVQVKCRKFSVENAELVEQEVVGHHDADISDIEHNELRQLDNAMRSRLNDVYESLTRAEGSQGFKVKKVFRYKREIKKPKFSSARLSRLMTTLERCESFEVVKEGEQFIVKLVLAGGAKSMSYVKESEVEELEKALSSRAELQRRRKPA